MKKLLLMLVAVTATMTAFANAEDEGWQKSFTPVADKSDLAGVHTAVASDGSVYASSTYNQAFQFAGKAVTDPDGLLSSCVVKYDAQGNEQWAVSLVGKCKINAMTADTDGTLYVAGQSQDSKVTCTGTDSNTKTIEGSLTNYVAFVAKISKDGVFEAVKTIQSAVNATIEESSMYFPEPGDIYVRPTNIRIDANKVLVSVNYTGDVAELSWSGRYLNVFDFMYQDNKAAGVFMVDKADLSNITSVANLGATEIVSYIQYYPDALNFTMYEGKPFVVFVGFGDLTLTTPAGSQQFNFETSDDESGNKEHAFVFVDATNPTAPKIFHAAKHDKESRPYNFVCGDIVNGNCYIGGTFYGNFPLDNSVTKDKNTSFVASIKMSDCSVNWAVANEVESEAKCMVVTGEEIHASTADALYVLKTANGELKGTEDKGFEDADSYNDQYVSTVSTDDNNVIVFCPKMNPSGINETKALKNAAAKIYNLNGVELSAPQKGLNIIKTTDGVKKVTVK